MMKLIAGLVRDFRMYTQERLTTGAMTCLGFSMQLPSVHVNRL